MHPGTCLDGASELFIECYLSHRSHPLVCIILKLNSVPNSPFRKKWCMLNLAIFFPCSALHLTCLYLRPWQACWSYFVQQQDIYISCCLAVLIWSVIRKIVLTFSNEYIFHWFCTNIFPIFFLYFCLQNSYIPIYTTGKKYGIFFISAIFCMFVERAGCFCTWNTFLRADITF